MRRSPKDSAAALTRVPHSFQGVDDQRAGILLHIRVRRTKHCRISLADHAGESGYDRDVLLAVRFVADDFAIMEVAVVGLPQVLAGFGV